MLPIRVDAETKRMAATKAETLGLSFIFIKLHIMAGSVRSLIEPAGV